MSRSRWRRCGDRAALIELDDLGSVLGLHAAISAEPSREGGPLDGVIDLVPAARTLLVRCTSADNLERARAHIDARIAAGATTTRAPGPNAPEVRVGVRYDGPDLDAVAHHLGCDRDEVVRRHCATRWRAAFTGFAPGFGYLVPEGSAGWSVPRRAEPRTDVPVGAVGLAGGFSGVYPRASPGGWQLIGRTDVPLWDPHRDPPALIGAGVRVRFEAGRTVMRVLRPGAATVQDLGRAGHVDVGVPESGALDPVALRLANRLVGNEEGAAGLEIVLGGLVLESTAGVWIALAGAPAGLAVITSGGRRRAHGAGMAVWAPPGGRVEVVAPRRGLRSWLAVRGGIEVPRVLGSASTDLLSGIGAPLVEGEALAVGTRIAGDVPAVDVAPCGLWSPPSDGLVELRAIRGPRDDWFDAASLRSLEVPRPVDPRSNRIGLRLGGEPLRRVPLREGAELASEGTVAGSVQIAANGLPVLFLADHPVTGGYPVAATVLTDDLALAAQASPGTQVRLRFVTGAARWGNVG